MQLHSLFLSFQAGRSFLHSSDARVKLACLLAWEVMIWNSAMTGVLSSLGAIIMLYIVCRVSLLRAYKAMKLIFFLSLIIILLPIITSLLPQLLSGQGPNTALYPAVYYALRLCTIALTTHLFFATTPMGTWVDVAEWSLLPWRKIRGAFGLMLMVVLNYIMIIQQCHHQLLLGLRARHIDKRRMYYRATLNYCANLIVMCARFADLTTLAVSARHFRYTRTPPSFTHSLPSTLVLVGVTLCSITATWYISQRL